MKAKAMVQCALFAALLAICAWVCVPFADIAFTLQTFGVFLTLGLLGGKRGSVAIGVYLLLGAVGLPVFSGFQGGAGVLLGVTGGYIGGFFFSGFVYWAITCRVSTPKLRMFAMIAGLATCYATGSVWFCVLYFSQGNALGIGAVLLKCVVPYLIPDVCKLALAWIFSEKLKRFV